MAYTLFLSHSMKDKLALNLRGSICLARHNYKEIQDVAKFVRTVAQAQ